MKTMEKIGVGGGGMSRTITGRVVVRNGRLAPGVVRRYGSLSCELDQAMVELAVGDVIVMISGTRDAPECHATLADGTTPCAVPEFDAPRLAEGLGRYHNRDGACFVA